MTAGCGVEADEFISEGIERIEEKVDRIGEANAGDTDQNSDTNSDTSNTSNSGTDAGIDAASANEDGTDAEKNATATNGSESDTGINPSSKRELEAGTEGNSNSTSDPEAGTEENNKDTSESNTSAEVDTETADNTQNNTDYNNTDGLLKSVEDIALRDVDGAGTNYVFTYNGEKFSAIYTTDNWKIINSYKIDNISDMVIICEALSEAHPIHGSDMTSFRTAEDMAYEWTQHNFAYDFLKDGDAYKEKAKDVDLNPEDQNKSFDEIYKDRTGKELSLEDILNRIAD